MSDAQKPANPPLFYPDDERSCTRNALGGITGAVPVTCTDITLRDLFAGFAMAGAAMSSGFEFDAVARYAYRFADAMLAERERAK